MARSRGLEGCLIVYEPDKSFLTQDEDLSSASGERKEKLDVLAFRF